LFLRNNNWGLPVIIGLILLLLVLEFVYPVIKSMRKKKVGVTSQDSVKGTV